MKKVILIDSISTNNYHEVFNFGFFYALSKIPNIKITYYISPSALDSLRTLALNNGVTLDNVEFRAIPVKTSNKSFQIFLKFISSFLINLRLLLKHKKEVVILSNVNPLMALFYPLWKNIVGARIYMIFHGELEYIVKKSPFYKPLWLYRLGIKRLLGSKLKQNHKFIVLGSSIKQNLIKLGYHKLEKHLVVFKHPYIFNEYEIQGEKDRSVLQIGIIGNASVEKGFNEVVSLSNRFKEDISKDKIKFILVGKADLDQDKYPNIDFASKNNQGLSYKDYNEIIKTLDVALFLYPSNTYKLTASGAVFDPLVHNVPIVSLNWDYVNMLFEENGNLGFISEDVNEIGLKIRELIKKKERSEKLFEEDVDDAISRLKQNYNFRNITLDLS